MKQNSDVLGFETILSFQTVLIFLLAAVLMGCSTDSLSDRSSNSGPPSITQVSSEQMTLAERIEFIEQYVIFRRSYLQLDYDVSYQNNSGGGIPGPSDWDIKILAAVPEAEIDDWVPEEAQRLQRAVPGWVAEFPGTIPTDGLEEWYSGGGAIVGIDRSTATILYWNTTFGYD